MDPLQPTRFPWFLQLQGSDPTLAKSSTPETCAEYGPYFPRPGICLAGAGLRGLGGKARALLQARRLGAQGPGARPSGREESETIDGDGR